MLVKHIQSISGLIFVAVTIGGFTGPVHAGKWIGVGDGLYVDEDSRARKGDIGSVFVRGPDNSSGLIEFDCKGRVVISPDSVAKQFDDDSPLGRIYATACKKWFEIWK